MVSWIEMRHIVYSDLDGTLLNEDYSYEAAKPAINFLLSSKTPLILCTSKTRAEIEVYREKLGVTDPFISENGGAIFIPRDYFTFWYDHDKSVEGYNVIELGKEYADLCRELKGIRKETGYKIVGFSDMTAEEIAKDCGLSLRDAELSKKREYDEAFTIEGTKGQTDEVFRSIESKGLNYTVGGRYSHIMGNSDKGKAVDILTELYKREKRGSEIKTVGLGDSLNDLPMLKAVDIPILVKKPDGLHDPEINFPNLIRIDGVGPVGWNKAINELFKEGKIYDKE